MPAANTSVKYFHSAMAGAPVIDITAGSLIAILDACLKDGFNLRPVDTLAVAGGVATVTMSTGAGAFEADTVALISGATPAELNGEKRVLSVTTNTITFDATGVSDQTATGTITAKLAPAGWDKPFAGTNLAAYRSADPMGTQMFLRVDDSGTTNARVVGYEAMTDVNTGVQAFPTAAMLAGGMYWPKANGTFKGWVLVADSRTFWLMTIAGNSAGSIATNGFCMGFGDFASRKSGDAYACFLSAATTDVSSDQSMSVQDAGASSYSGVSLGTNGLVAARAFTGLGGAAPLARVAGGLLLSTSNTASGSANGVTSYPNGPDNALLLVPMVVLESGPVLRGSQRGILFVPQNAYAAFLTRDKVDGQGALLGRKLVALRAGMPANTSTGVLFIDITGPWG